MIRVKYQKRNRSKAAIILFLLTLIVLGGIFAFLTATDTATNRFTLAKAVDIEVVEAKWDALPDSAKTNIVPKQEIIKDPLIRNTTGTPAYVFAQVVVPRKTVVTASDNGNTATAAATDLFTYTVNEGWTEFGTPVVTETSTTYFYYYDTVLSSGDTSTIFDKVKYANVVDGQISGSDCLLNVIVNGYAIQSNGFATPQDAWNAYTGEESVPMAIAVSFVNENINDSDSYELYEVAKSAAPTLKKTTVAKLNTADFNLVMVDPIKGTDAPSLVCVEEGDDPVDDAIASVQVSAADYSSGKIEDKPMPPWVMPTSLADAVSAEKGGFDNLTRAAQMIVDELETNPSASVPTSVSAANSLMSRCPVTATFAKFMMEGQTFTTTYNNVDVKMRIIGIAHDEKIDGTTAGLTFSFYEPPHGGVSFNDTNTMEGGWPASALRRNLNNPDGGYVSKMDPKLVNVMEPVKKKTNENEQLTSASSAYIATTGTGLPYPEKMFLISAREYMGDSADAIYKSGYLKYEGTQYEYYKYLGVTRQNNIRQWDRETTGVTACYTRSCDGSSLPYLTYAIGFQSDGSWCGLPGLGADIESHGCLPCFAVG